MALIEIKKNKFDIDIDLRYATKNNITGRKITSGSDETGLGR